MRSANGNAPDKAGGPTGAQREHNTGKHHKRLGAIAAIKRRMWLVGYELEESRQLYSTDGRHWKARAVCITLALLRRGRLA